MKKIKQLLAVLILFISVLSALSAQSEGKSHIQCDCITRRCECFIQYGDRGGAVKEIIRILKEKKYLSKDISTQELNGDVEDAIIHFQEDNKLEDSGQMDDDTLTLLLWDMFPEELDKTNNNYRTVYIPVNGGKKRHLSPSCSGMDHPRKVSDRNAEKLGFDRCKKCYGKTP